MEETDVDLIYTPTQGLKQSYSLLPTPSIENPEFVFCILLRAGQGIEFSKEIFDVVMQDYYQ